MNELAAFAAGRWQDFHGLAECPWTAADAELGRPREDRLHGGRFGGEPAQFRRYPETTTAPRGITVWVLGELVIGLEISDAAPPDPVLEALGPPEAVIASELGGAWVQQLWASRGLVLHRRETQIRVVFGLAPFDLQDWESDPLRWWRIERRPR